MFKSRPISIFFSSSAASCQMFILKSYDLHNFFLTAGTSFQFYPHFRTCYCHRTILVSHALLIWVVWANLLPNLVQNGEDIFKSTGNHISFVILLEERKSLEPHVYLFTQQKYHISTAPFARVNQLANFELLNGYQNNPREEKSCLV